MSGPIDRLLAHSSFIANLPCVPVNLFGYEKSNRCIVGQKITPPLTDHSHATKLIVKPFYESLDVNDYFRYYYKIKILSSPFFKLL